ncbi:hypothetical protein [Plantactinospora sp. KLBMP9567]|uniref:hypothetical protein n=1 Tax=Plantactinospora sp. KLBMP9567 TaxID=3085900 RepID=UPI002981EFC8|nr:hypothetical protein [Plantactinospora sp. KLBMP9567]MDW5328367.1 hypothetical protein [Plantactinospora sp. KLBMP9567]
MLVVDVVLETYDVLEFAAWPIAEPSSDRLLMLSGQMSPAEVGTAIAVIVSYNQISVDSIRDLTADLLNEHLAEAEALIAPGGLRFRDTTTDVQVAPGCCFGLENWRDWWDVARGQDLWLGHDPTPQLEFHDQAIWLRQSDQDSSQFIEIPLNELPSLLISAQQQLSTFLTLVQRWTTNTAPSLTNRLVAALDEHLRINQ